MLTVNRTRSNRREGWMPMLLLLSVALLSLPAAAQKVNITYLTSDIPNVTGTSINDTNLVNPWGMSISPSGPWWISDNGTGLSTLYDGSGNPQSLVVTIPPASGTGTGVPTGTVYNPSTTDFKVHGFVTPFLFCTEDGTVSGWYTGTQAFIAVNNNNGAVYKGCTLGSAGGANYLYVANFNSGAIEAYDRTFAAHSFGANAFVDSTLPSGFAPFNIQNIGNGKLAVAYAKQDAAHHDDVPGPGNGYVDVYDTSGNLQFRLTHVLWLNSPWGLVVAPSTFSGFANNLLVGNFGSGAVVAFNASTGAWIGNMLNVANLPVQVNGLWGLAFGNGGMGGASNTLYFTAGYFDEAHGIFGMMTPHFGP